MPEAPVEEKGNSQVREEEVRLSSHVHGMHLPAGNPSRAKHCCHTPFSRAVPLAADFRHHFRTFAYRENVHSSALFEKHHSRASSVTGEVDLQRREGLVPDAEKRFNALQLIQTATA